jgi:hypothetical protein
VTSVDRCILVKIFNEKFNFWIWCLLRILLTLIFLNLLCNSFCSLQFVLHRVHSQDLFFFCSPSLAQELFSAQGSFLKNHFSVSAVTSAPVWLFLPVLIFSWFDSFTGASSLWFVCAANYDLLSLLCEIRWGRVDFGPCSSACRAAFSSRRLFQSTLRFLARSAQGAGALYLFLIFSFGSIVRATR